MAQNDEGGKAGVVLIVVAAGWLVSYIEALPIDDIPDPSEVTAIPEAPTPPTAPEPSTLVDQAAAALGLAR